MFCGMGIGLVVGIAVVIMLAVAVGAIWGGTIFAPRPIFHSSVGALVGPLGWSG